MRFVESASATAEMRPMCGTFPGVATALAQGLRLPLTALRASVETLAQELGRRDEGQVMLRAILEEVELLGHNVQHLMDFTEPATPRPLTCSVEEIALSARRELPAARRERLTITHQVGAGSLEVDAPLIARTLGRLIENSFEAGSEEVRLQSSRDGQFTHFAVIDDAPEIFEPQDAAAPFHSSKPNRFGLGLTLVHRDLAMQGGWLEFERSPGGGTRATVTIPNRLAREEAA